MILALAHILARYYSNNNHYLPYCSVTVLFVYTHFTNGRVYHTENIALVLWTVGKTAAVSARLVYGQDLLSEIFYKTKQHSRSFLLFFNLPFS